MARGVPYFSIPINFYFRTFGYLLDFQLFSWYNKSCHLIISRHLPCRTNCVAFTQEPTHRRVFPLHTIDIVLRTPDRIQSFVNLTNSYPFTISLRQGRAVIDAKSILGIYSLDLSKPVIVEVYSSQARDLLDELQKYAA